MTSEANMPDTRLPVNDLSDKGQSQSKSNSVLSLGDGPFSAKELALLIYMNEHGAAIPDEKWLEKAASELEPLARARNRILLRCRR